MNVEERMDLRESADGSGVWVAECDKCPRAFREEIRNRLIAELEVHDELHDGMYR